MGKLAGKAVVVAGTENVVGRAVVAAVAAAGGRVHEIGAISALDPAAWDESFDQSHSRFGSVDVFINARHMVQSRSIGATSAGQFTSDVFDLAAAGWLAQKHAILALRKSGGGVIVSILSVLARVAAPNAAALSAAARGLLMSSKSAALECARAGDKIVVNAVLAGRIEGDSHHWPDGGLLPTAPPVTADEVAAAALYFATDGAAYVTGAEIPVDGGFLAS